MNNDTPRIYVACLAAYNNGKLHGLWIDADDPEDMNDAIEKMLEKSPIPDAEEWSIHDYEGFCGMRVDECPDLEELAEHAKAIEKHGEAWAHYCSYIGNDYATLDNFNDAYCGHWDNEKAFAEDLFDNVHCHLERIQLGHSYRST